MDPVPEFTTVESLFVRHRNVMAVRATLTPIYTDYYLHLMEQKLKYDPALDLKLKELLAALTLHLTARPWAENIAWTANLRAPRINLFASGSSTHETITGRLFTEDIREPDQNYLYSQTLLPGQKPSTSVIPIDSTNPLDWIAQYYSNSEQRPGRAFELPDETFILLAAQPDFDEEWLNAQTAESLLHLEKDNETKLLETRKFKFHCGCTLDKILPILGAWKDKKEELFENDDHLKIQCPRCAASYQVTRDMLD